MSTADSALTGARANPPSLGTGGWLGSAAVLGAAAGAASLIGWFAAQSGGMMVLALAGGIVGLVAISLTSRRTELGLFGLGLSLVLLLHKSVGPQDPLISSGPISVYITSFDLVVAALWVSWFVEGDVWPDLVATLRRPAAWLPLLGALLLSISIVLAEEPFLAVGEMVRMSVLWLAYLFLGARVRSRRDFAAVLWALAAVALIQVVTVVLQWRTGGVLGLDFLGIPTELGERTADTTALGRPFGTVIHPVFLGALLGTIGTTATAFAIHLTNLRLRLAALLIAIAVVLPLVLAQARAASVAFAISAGVLVVHGLVTRRISRSAITRTIVALALVALPFTPMLARGLTANFGTDHFWLEIESRMELNEVAVQMWEDNPELGVGLNNFEQSMDRYDRGLIFGGHPVHNLFLLVLAESGVLGLLGLALAGLALAIPALQLLRTRDPVFRATGAAMAGVLVFFLFEEQLGFSLRQDQPRAVFWIVAGLCLAASRLADGQPRAPLAARPIRPAATPDPPARPPLSDDAGYHAPPQPQPQPELEPTLASEAHSPSMRIHARSRRRRDRWLRSLRAPSTYRVPRFVGALIAVVAFAGAGLTAHGSSAAGDPFSNARIVITGVDRSTGLSGVYVAQGDGDLRRISPDDGRQYTWASWAPGANAVAWAARENRPNAPANLEIARPDGSSIVALTSTSWTSGQPKWSSDGRSIVFSSFHPEYPQVGIYRIDLTSFEVTNLSAVTQHSGAYDGDPRLADDGRIMFARGHDDERRETVPNQIWSMADDGTDRRKITDDDWFNTDPDIHPDGTTVAIASYRGEGHPSVPDQPDASIVKLQDWLLVERDVSSGTETIHNEGLPCFERGPRDACAPLEGPAFVPIYTPAGDGLAYVSVLSRTLTCICGLDRSTGTARVLAASEDIAISWFDLTESGGTPDGLFGDIGTAIDESRLLVTGEDIDGAPVLRAMRPDGWLMIDIPLPDGLVPVQASWGEDRSYVLVVARDQASPADREPHPAPPPGQRRQEHFTLDMLSPSFDPIVRNPNAHELQVLRIDIDSGATDSLTDAYLEDWRDGLLREDRRGNSEPVVSPDGSAIVVTNVSTLTDESFLLRLDVATGDVLSLTNGTSGAVAVADRSPGFSPDGERLVFVSNVGTITDLFTMDAATGLQIEQITDDDHPDLSPRWSPDGRRIAYISFGRDDFGMVLSDDSAVRDVADGAVPLMGWSLMTIDLDTGQQRVLVDGNVLPSFRPTWSPDGERLAFVGITSNGLPNVYLIAADGQGGPILQPTMLTHELDLDWR